MLRLLALSVAGLGYQQLPTFRPPVVKHRSAVSGFLKVTLTEVRTDTASPSSIIRSISSRTALLHGDQIATDLDNVLGGAAHANKNCKLTLICYVT